MARKPTLTRDAATGRLVGYLITHNGETLNASAWANRLGISLPTFLKGLEKHGSERVVSDWRRTVDAPHEHNGVKRTLHEWAASLGVKYYAFMKRVDEHGLANAIEQGGPILNKRLTLDGESLTLHEWATRAGVSYTTFMKRMEIMPLERAVKMISPYNTPYTSGGITLTIKEWAQRLNIEETVFRRRVKKYGIDGAITYEPPPPPKPKEPKKPKRLPGHCRKNHPVTGANVIIVRKYGKEVERCRECIHASQRAWTKKNRPKRKSLSTMCRSGAHPLSGGNLRISPDGSRQCRACTAARARLRSSEKRRGIYVPKLLASGLTLEEKFELWIKPGNGGCQIWSGPRAVRNRPIINHGTLPKGKRLVRSLMWERKTGAPLAPHETLIMSCANEDCVAAEHLVMVRKRERLRIANVTEKRLMKMRLRHNPNSERYMREIMVHRNAAYRAIHKYKALENERDDILQDAAMRVYKKMLLEGEGAIPDIKSFLIIIARNLAVDYMRRRNIVPVVSITAEEVRDRGTGEKDYYARAEDYFSIAAPLGADPAIALEQEEEWGLQRKRLLWRVRQLSGRRREAVLLKADGLSQAEIAEKMQLSENTVEGHLRVAYAALRGTRKMGSLELLYTGTDD